MYRRRPSGELGGRLAPTFPAPRRLHHRRLKAGERLFGETSDKKPMRLISARTIGDRLAYLTYTLVRDA